MKKIVKNQKAKTSGLIKMAHSNDMTLACYKKILDSVHEIKLLRRKSNRYGTTLDWDNAEFDHALQWLFVTEIIQSPKKEESCVSIFRSLAELPLERQSQFQTMFTQK